MAKQRRNGTAQAVLAAAFLVVGHLPAAAQTNPAAGPARAQTPVLLAFVEGDTQFAVRRAAEGAAARLARPGCPEVFNDFTDATGRPLSTVLAAKEKRPAEAFGGLRFFDDGAAPQCRAGITLAFTQIGSPVIRICSLQFRDRSTWNRTGVEMILIHEFLHTLGLAENPPTSREITIRVAARCGR